MDDEFNMSVRKFLKQVGVTSQSAIEAAMREMGAAAAGKTHKLRMELTIEGVDQPHVVEGQIKGPKA